jgi:hypothetical protein
VEEMELRGGEGSHGPGRKACKASEGCHRCGSVQAPPARSLFCRATQTRAENDEEEEEERRRTKKKKKKKTKKTKRRNSYHFEETKLKIGRKK